MLYLYCTFIVSYKLYVNYPQNTCLIEGLRFSNINVMSWVRFLFREPWGQIKVIELRVSLCVVLRISREHLQTP